MIREGSYRSGDPLVPVLTYDSTDINGQVSWTGNFFIKDSGDYTFKFLTKW